MKIHQVVVEFFLRSQSAIRQSFSTNRRLGFAVVGSVIFFALLILQLVLPREQVMVTAYEQEETPVARMISMLKKEQKILQPIPSGNPTPLPTFTPTPTNTPTPTPTPTNTPTPTPTFTPTPTINKPPPPAPAEIDGYFKKYASEFSVDEGKMRKIAACESGYNSTSHNTTYDYGGMYQFSRDTWVNTRAHMGADTNPDLRFNAEEAIRTAAFKISRGGENAWKNCL